MESLKKIIMGLASAILSTHWECPFCHYYTEVSSLTKTFGGRGYTLKPVNIWFRWEWLYKASRFFVCVIEGDWDTRREGMGIFPLYKTHFYYIKLFWCNLHLIANKKWNCEAQNTHFDWNTRQFSHSFFSSNIVMKLAMCCTHNIPRSYEPVLLAMQWGEALRSAFYRGRENIYE